MPAENIRWLEPIRLDFDEALDDNERFLKILRRQFRQRLHVSGLSEAHAVRCVYVVRITGGVLVAYKRKNSPVLYIGSGNVSVRATAHINNWMSHVPGMGTDTHVEVRIIVPRRQKRPDFYKNVEADLISWFRRKQGSIPFFNRRRELKFANRVSYSASQKKQLHRLVGIGSGHRPRWAIKPTPANEMFATFLKGEDIE